MNDKASDITLRVDRLLTDGRFLEAIDMLKPKLGRPEITDLLLNAEITYRQMLRFMPGIAPDAGRDRILNEVREKIRVVADSIERDKLSGYDSSYYFSKLRTFRLQPSASIESKVKSLASVLDIISLADVADSYSSQRHEEFERSLSILFDLILINHTLSKGECGALRAFFESIDYNEENSRVAALTLVSALMLSALQYYDSAKLQLLLNLYARAENPQMAARAFVASALVMSRHGRRAKGDAALEAAAELCAERPEFRKEMRAFVASILRTVDTDRVNRKMREEIIPDLMKLKPELEKRMKNIDSEDLKADEIPEWMEMIEKSGIEAKLKEFSEMQMDGSDVFMGAFAGMKNFPFFNDFSAWFMPFTSLHSKVQPISGRLPAGLLDVALKMPMLCSSDKYSLAFSLDRMPSGRSGIMLSQMQTQLDALTEEQRASLSETVKSTVESEIGMYLKDLFRFFRISAHRGDFNDPFAGHFVMPDSPLFSLVSEDEELRRLVADFYFKYGYWKEASRLYDLLSALQHDQSDDLQKSGYCKEMYGDTAGALDCYRRAELISEPGKWLLKRIAGCLRGLKRYDEAAGYYSRVIELDPDNVRLELLRGHSLLEAGDLANALKAYYKVDYLDPDSGKALRPIAWCEFLQGNYEKSLDRYKRITESADATASDWLNRGHVSLISGSLADAAAAYREVVTRKGGDEFRRMLAADAPTLQCEGVEKDTLALVADYVMAGV